MKTGIYRSVDGSYKWREVLAGEYTAFAVNPKNVKNIFALGTRHERGYEVITLSETTNGGSYWSTRTVFPLSPGIGTQIVLDPGGADVIYVTGILNKSEYALFKSLNKGANWARIGKNVFKKSEILDLAVDPNLEGLIYAATAKGVFQSFDSGITWKKVSLLKYNKSEHASIRINPKSPKEVYFAGESGVYFSPDRGNSWHEYNSGIPSVSISCLEIDPVNRFIYAGSTRNSVLKNNLGEVFRLTVKAGNGGTTSPAPSMYSHVMGSQVQITAVPGTGNAFLGWSYDAFGQENPQTITVTGDKTIKANFGPEGGEFPVVQLSTNLLSFNWKNGSKQLNKILKIRNSGEKTLNYKLKSNRTWINLSLNSGSSDGNWNRIKISVDVPSLNAGTHTGILTVTSDKAANSPVYVSVIVNVG